MTQTKQIIPTATPADSHAVFKALRQCAPVSKKPAKVCLYVWVLNFQSAEVSRWGPFNSNEKAEDFTETLHDDTAYMVTSDSDFMVRR